MKKIICISEVVDSAKTWQGGWEACATAEAQYDEARQELEVILDCFLRPLDAPDAHAGISPAWLPLRNRVREKVSLEEATDLARDIFRNWVQKVRQKIPASEQASNGKEA